MIEGRGVAMANKAVIQSLQEKEKLLQEQIELFKSVQKGGQQLRALTKSVYARFAANSGAARACTHVRWRRCHVRGGTSCVLSQPDIQKCVNTKGQLDTQLNENKAVKEVRFQPRQCLGIFLND